MPHGEDEPAPMEELVEQLAGILGDRLGQRSRWALRTAADARQVEGIPGCVVIMLPSSTREFVDVTFTTGVVEAVTRPA